ncbi:MAG TPA: pirin family protein [Chitinivibrionales bacterium]|nr:pirin family protein [Chitinivibrionales bacterium]
MNELRPIKMVMRSRPTLEGAGVSLKRAFGYYHVPQLDPFLLLDDFHSDDPDDYVRGFPWHPHRGIETVTYVLHGAVEHGDSMGNSGVISSGDIQWMTAGSGIIHQEMPKGSESGLMWGFQLWANLPASRKMMEPRYRGILKSQVPEVTLANGVRIKIICGAVNGAEGPVSGIVTEPEYLDIFIPEKTEYSHKVKKGHTAFAYVIEGRGIFCNGTDPYQYDMAGSNYFDMARDAELHAESLVLFGDGSVIAASTNDESMRFLLVSGEPINEPVAWYGPIVMNTQEELRIAFEEYNNGTFVKTGAAPDAGVHKNRKGAPYAGTHK